MLGDFNANIKKKEKNSFNKQLKELTEALGMSEVMQILHPENTTPTCIKHNGRSTIDHIFVTEDLKARVISCEIKPYVYSDHQAKIMEMATLKTVAADRKTSTYWKQNINSLEEIE